jgi:diaminohydroxyphosphoribosylaminopyrimidine deaminase/5-amino-6-(5-phosphoribosylamino)uracil reductase
MTIAPASPEREEGLPNGTPPPAGSPEEGDARWMRRALRLAERARGRTTPNPLVGAVLVKDGQVVGEGYHRRAGEAHAEVAALRAAGPEARGATLYVTLEPCSHHGRTPPCCDAVIAAGVARVVAASEDPDPRVNGRGLVALRAAGIDLQVGLLAAEARRQNEVFFKFVTRGLPFVTLKSAMTLDGKIATRTGDSRWVTGERARAYVHRLRAENDAIMAGIGTARADDPLLTARRPRARNPLRVIVDARAELSLASQIGRTLTEVPTVVATTGAAPAVRRAALREAGAQVLELPEQGGRVDLTALLQELARRPVTSLLLEGGAELAAAMLGAGLVDKVICFIAPKIVGGRGAPGPVGGEGIARMADALPLHHVTLRRFGADYAFTGYLNP